MKVALVAGARPNFMKIAPLAWAMAGRDDFEALIVHTGQHYDDSMSRVFFTELGIPAPNINLEVGSGSHAQQTSRVMATLEPVLVAAKPDWVVVVGDVNSTLAAALVAVKMGISTAHVEAGLRSGDRSMPEEINRMATDAVCDLLLAPSVDALQNLQHEGHPEQRLVLVGNIMVDTLLHFLPQTDLAGVKRRLKLAGDYALVTLHRPTNVDDPTQLEGIISALAEVATEIEIVFPVHPRTRPLLESIWPRSSRPPGLRILEPLPYLDFIALEQGAGVVLTDSGGIQEETTILGVPCLTFRENTERPITVTEGTNRVLGTDPGAIAPALKEAASSQPTDGHRPKGWDGHAAPRILDALAQSSLSGRGAPSSSPAPAQAK